MSNEIKVFWFIVVTLIILIIWIIQNYHPKNEWQKYKKIQYIINSILYAAILLVEWIYRIYLPLAEFPRGGAISVSLMTLAFLIHWTISIKYKKIINNEISYKIWVASFICWSMGTLLIIIALLTW